MKDIKDLLFSGKVWTALPKLRDELLHLRKYSATWPATIKEIQSDTILTNELDKCPYTHRAKCKPRGYAGDAVMMDFIYGIYPNNLFQNIDFLAEEIFRFTTNSAAARAVRHRRRLIAKSIDDACATNKTKILSVACGHLREAGISVSIQKQSFTDFVALDQDAESLFTVESKYGNLGVKTIASKIAKIAEGQIPAALQNKFDFIYSAGLYDYLNDETAIRLTRNLFNLTDLNGEILLSNFMPDHEDAGFMEAIMNWHLVYRTPEQLVNILMQSGFIVTKTTTDPTSSIVYAHGIKSK